MTDLTIMGAQAALLDRAWFTTDYRDYLRAQDLDIDVVNRVVGASAVTTIVNAGDGRFEFGQEGEAVGFVCEALDRDGVTVEDLVAWPLAAPGTVMTMLGRAVILGLEFATNPASFHGNRPLPMFRTPLGLLRHGGKGAVVLDTSRAGRLLIDFPGLIAGEDARHARELLAMAEAVIDRSKFVAPNIADLRIAA